MFGTRALLDAHTNDCRDDRERTAMQFNAVITKIDKLEGKFEDSARRREAQHAENQMKLDRLSRLVYMAAGAVTLVGFLFSDYGRAALELIGSAHK